MRAINGKIKASVCTTRLARCQYQTAGMDLIKKIGKHNFAGIISGADSRYGCIEIALAFNPHLFCRSNDDNIDDGNEHDYWGEDWATNFDGDGISNNLVDDDSDGDGYLDGDEISAGYDPSYF